MSCDRFELWIVSDDPAEHGRAAEHAEGCARCAEILAGHTALRGEIEQWSATPRPRPQLEGSIRRSIVRAVRDAAPERSSAARRRPLWLWGSLAASLLVGAALAFVGFGSRDAVPESAERLVVAEALSGVEAAERQHARAIQKLERAAAPLLAAASDPATPPQRAARLFEFRDRIAFLDTTIHDVRGFIDDNPGNAGARSLLLSAYQEKTQVLREVLALEERS